jgi:2,4-dienoyl-CoA reductase-like NADH-dependent reductase (Old Yellow Enzyme family)
MKEVYKMGNAKYTEMFKPIKIGNVELKNRLAMAPVTTNFTQAGYITEQQIAFLGARARGGAGLIVTPPAMNMLPGGSAHVLTPSLSERAHMPGWNELAETIHAFGAKAFGQVVAGVPGRQMLRGAKAKGTSPLPLVRVPRENIPKGQLDFEARKGLSSLWDMYSDGPVPEQLTLEEIEWIENEYAKMSRLMKESGLDGAELHFAHGYLADNFLSPRTNIRTDAYGGSFGNRTRFFRNIVTKSRLQAGLDFVIGVRLTGDEHMPGGLNIEDSTRIAKMGEELGLDYIHLTSGCWEAVKWYVPEQDGTMLPEAEAMKQTVKIPVITPSIHDPAAAEKAIKQGKTDMVSLCRPLIVDPEWVKKAADGKDGRIRKCIRCLACLRRTRHGLSMRCEINREVGRERYNPQYWHSAAPGKKHYYVPR